MFLVLLEATSRRAGSVRLLRWEDINFATGEITWKAESDKKRKEWIVPIPQTLIDELRTFQKKLGAISGWIFPSGKNSTEAARRDVLEAQLLKAEREAKLTKLKGGVFHPYRRKWATERKHLSLKDVAAAGGWKDVGTILTSYQHADWETMLQVMSEPKKVTERGVAGT